MTGLDQRLLAMGPGMGLAAVPKAEAKAHTAFRAFYLFFH